MLAKWISIINVIKKVKNLFNYDTWIISMNWSGTNVTPDERSAMSETILQTFVLI